MLQKCKLGNQYRFGCMRVINKEREREIEKLMGKNKEIDRKS